jgi:AcrR family transcriptional regulator
MSRDEVLSAAADAFTDRGYAATTMDDVALRLHATKGRVYHYFKTKGELFLGAHRRAMVMAIERVEPIARGTGRPSQRLFEMAKAHAGLMMEESSSMRLSAQVHELRLTTEGRTTEGRTTEGRTTEAGLHDLLAMRKEYEEVFRKVVKEGMDAGEFRKADADLLAKAALGALNWMSVWYSPAKAHAESMDETAGEMARFVVAGMSADP